jgi:hypothetical protein
MANCIAAIQLRNFLFKHLLSFVNEYSIEHKAYTHFLENRQFLSSFANTYIGFKPIQTLKWH